MTRATTSRQQSHQRRHADDPLSCELIDAIVLQAALDGCGVDEIRERLNQARADVEDGVMDSEGRIVWAH